MLNITARFCFYAKINANTWIIEKHAAAFQSQFLISNPLIQIASTTNNTEKKKVFYQVYGKRVNFLPFIINFNSFQNWGKCHTFASLTLFPIFSNVPPFILSHQLENLLRLCMTIKQIQKIKEGKLGFAGMLSLLQVFSPLRTGQLSYNNIPVSWCFDRYLGWWKTVIRLERKLTKS